MACGYIAVVGESGGSVSIDLGSRLGQNTGLRLVLCKGGDQTEHGLGWLKITDVYHADNSHARIVVFNVGIQV